MAQNMPANGGVGRRIVEEREPPSSRSQVPVITRSPLAKADHSYLVHTPAGRAVLAQQRSEEFEKAQRYYDPEHRRQRRMGIQEAALLGAGGALMFRGGRGVKRSTQAARALKDSEKGSVGGAGAINYQGNHERGKHWR